MVKDERKNALVHVEDTLSQLNRMSDHLGDLRERVAEPIIASSLNIPIEVNGWSYRDVPPLTLGLRFISMVCGMQQND
jgi:hypothetical protein